MHSILPLPTNALKYSFRAHRLVVLPDFQGLGIGTKINQFFGEYYVNNGLKYFMRTTHMRLAENMKNDARWFATNSSGKKQDVHRKKDNPSKVKYDTERLAVSYEYKGNDYVVKPHKTIIVDDVMPTMDELKSLKEQYYLTIVTGWHKAENDCEKMCKELGIRTELLYKLVDGKPQKIKKYETMKEYYFVRNNVI